MAASLSPTIVLLATVLVAGLNQAAPVEEPSKPAPVTVSPGDSTSCPHGWSRFGNKKCLKYVNELQDYERATALCRSKNQGNLVTIHSQDEQNYVFSYMHSIAASSAPIWLGARQIDFESILWLDKTETSYTNWAQSEPSHPDEICIAVNPKNGLWHDVMCAEANVPACERAPTTQWPFFVAFCSEGWFQFNDEKCIRLIGSQALNFHESQELCRSKYNSKLLSIKSEKESEFLHNLIKFKDVKLPVWLGAVQNDFSSFSWIDKSDVTFTNWADSEPNDPDQACLSMRASGGKWADNDCKDQKLIVCQKVVPDDGAGCGNGWLQFRQDKCYRFVHVRLSFDDAESLCQNLYAGHLPSVHSQEEQFMLTQFLASVNVKNGSEIWLGGRQMDFHNFNWADGSQFNYSFWEHGEPNFPAEKCIEMSWRNGRWNDIGCKLKRAVLCERQLIQLNPARNHLVLKPNLYQPSNCLFDSTACSQQQQANTSLVGLLAVADQQQQQQVETNQTQAFVRNQNQNNVVGELSDRDALVAASGGTGGAQTPIESTDVAASLGNQNELAKQEFRLTTNQTLAGLATQPTPPVSDQLEPKSGLSEPDSPPSSPKIASQAGCNPATQSLQQHPTEPTPTYNNQATGSQHVDRIESVVQKTTDIPTGAKLESNSTVSEVKQQSLQPTISTQDRQQQYHDTVKPVDVVSTTSTSASTSTSTIANDSLTILGTSSIPTNA